MVRRAQGQRRLGWLIMGKGVAMAKELQFEASAQSWTQPEGPVHRWVQLPTVQRALHQNIDDLESMEFESDALHEVEPRAAAVRA